jgi:DNA-binding transcriptional MocR family regulator
MAISEFLQTGGYDAHLRKIRRFYAAQVQCMSAAVCRYFPEGTKVTRPTGGMCIWTELPGNVDSLAVYEQAMAAKITIAPGRLFSAKQKFENFIRLNCGNPWSAEVENALRTLGKIIHAQMQSNGASRQNGN